MVVKATSVNPDANQTSTDRILNASEMLFAERGYAGASMRDIARAAEAPVSLITHHFGTKEELFRQVIDRRIHDQVATTLDDIAKAQIAANDTPVPLETLIRCYMEPMVLKSIHGGLGWKNYAKLMGLAMFNSQYDDFLKPMIDVYDRVQYAFVEECRKIFPNADERRLQLAVFFLNSSILSVLVESGMLDRQSGGICKSSDLQMIVDEMIPFYAAAFRQRLNAA
ncbi:TetR/AcrR family transcriptional regulator [Aquisediminimonas sediminicola]|uniref:TetR/AcrR family transcriptional regulator n=1 Tax=Alteraquisediminimonas sediminicola TaxID=2676787 RepID=UPI0024848C1E|nr:TetR/AcrR family transcriptional regulator [Aquisediminimonas sediminicola]